MEVDDWNDGVTSQEMQRIVWSQQKLRGKHRVVPEGTNHVNTLILDIQPTDL